MREDKSKKKKIQQARSFTIHEHLYGGSLNDVCTLAPLTQQRRHDSEADAWARPDELLLV